MAVHFLGSEDGAKGRAGSCTGVTRKYVPTLPLGCFYAPRTSLTAPRTSPRNLGGACQDVLGAALRLCAEPEESAASLRGGRIGCEEQSRKLWMKVASAAGSQGRHNLSRRSGSCLAQSALRRRECSRSSCSEAMGVAAARPVITGSRLGHSLDEKRRSTRSFQKLASLTPDLDPKWVSEQD